MMSNKAAVDSHFWLDVIGHVTTRSCAALFFTLDYGRWLRITRARESALRRLLGLWVWASHAPDSLSPSVYALVTLPNITQGLAPPVRHAGDVPDSMETEGTVRKMDSFNPGVFVWGLNWQVPPSTLCLEVINAKRRSWSGVWYRCLRTSIQTNKTRVTLSFSPPIPSQLCLSHCRRFLQTVGNSDGLYICLAVYHPLVSWCPGGFVHLLCTQTPVAPVAPARLAPANRLWKVGGLEENRSWVDFNREFLTSQFRILTMTAAE